MERAVTSSASRLTRRQQAILGAFEGADAPMTAREAWEAARDEIPTIGLATVYRAVKTLTGEGSLRQIEIVDETPRYEPATRPHHHHFFCRACGRLFEIRKCPPSLRDMVPDGFAMEDHSIVLYGSCEECLATA